MRTSYSANTTGCFPIQQTFATVVAIVIAFFFGALATNATTYYSTYGQSRTESTITLPASGTHTFEVNGIAQNKTTYWFVGGVYKETDSSGLLAYDPDYSFFFSSGTTEVQADVYNSDGTFKEYHLWRITINSGAPEIDVRGNGVSIADGDTTPSTGDYTDFGTVAVGTTVARTFYVYNTGTTALTPGSITLPSGYTLTVGLNSSIPAGSSDYLTVRLNAASAGTYVGDISIPNNDANENPYNFRITGTVSPPAAPEIDVRGNGVSIVDGDATPSTGDYTDFGSTPAGTTVDRTFNVYNTGTAALTPGAITLPSGYTLAVALNSSIPAGSSDYFTVRLNAASAGTYAGDISIPNNDANENPYNFRITGTVSCPTPGFPSSPSPANGAPVGSQPTILNWSDVSGATSYDVYLDGTYRANVAVSQWTLNQTLTLTSHSWYVIARNSCGQSIGPPVVWSFTISCPTPNTPSGPSPANGATVSSQPATLDWADTSGATSYDVYLDGTYRANVAVSQWTLNQSLALSSHNWYVVAKNSCGPSTSPTWSFTIQSDPNDQISEAVSLGIMANDRSVLDASIANSKDVNIYSFTVSAGQKIAFDIDRLSSGFNTYLRLFNGSGSQLAFNDDGSAPNETSTTDSWLEYTFATSGTYYIGVSSYGNRSYDPLTGGGDVDGDTGVYNLHLSVVGGNTGFDGISGSLSDGNGTFAVSLQRQDAPNAGIDPTRRTWIVIHGLNSSRDRPNIQAVASALTGTRPLTEQVLTLDWSEGSTLGDDGEDRIPLVGQWAATALFNHGFQGAKLNLIGHSWGSYVCVEISERIQTGVDTIVGLDPAEDVPVLGGYDPESVSEVNFALHSNYSWTFHSSCWGSPMSPTTADEAFIVATGYLDNSFEAHSAVVFMFADIIAHPTGGSGINPLFRLERLLDHLPSQWWVPNSENTPFPCDNNSVGGYEGIIQLASNHQTPELIQYRPTTPEITVLGNGVSITDGDNTPGSSDGTDFGSVIQGQAGATRIFTVRNAGGSTLTLGSVSVPLGFILDAGLLTSLDPGASDTFTVRLDTTSVGTKSGQISFSNNDGNESPFNFSITGTVSATPTRIVSLSGSLAFGNVAGGSSAQRILTIANSGNSVMTVSSIVYPAGFSGDWTSGTIAAGAPRNVTVTFSPGAATGYGGTVTVNSDKTSGVNTTTASGTGTVAPTRVIALSGNLAFGNVTVGASVQSTLTIANNGNAVMTVSSIVYPAGFSGNWASGTIPAGGSRNVTVTFSPSAATGYGGTVTVNSDKTSGVNTTAASGTGTATPTRVIALSGSLAFGSVIVNSSAQRTLTIANNGNSALTVSSISYPNGFSGNWSGTIPAGGSQSVNVAFSPSSSGSYSGTVTVNSDKTGGVNTTAASGTGTTTPTRVISLSGNLAFGNVIAGASAQRTLTIANNGNSTLTVNGISYPNDFSGSWSAGTIPAGGSQNITVTFSPILVTSYGGTVTVSSDKTGGGNTIEASGAGTVLQTRVIALGGNLGFGSVTVGVIAQRTLTIANNGGSTLTISSVSYPNGFSGNWSGGTIPSGGSHDITVTFSPLAALSYGGTISVSSDATSGTSTITASGTGTIVSLPEIAVLGNSVIIPSGDNSPSLADGTDFGSVDVTNGLVTHTFTIANNGTAALNLTGNPKVLIDGIGDFSVLTQPTSPVPAGGGATFRVQFNPSATGLRAARLEILNSTSSKNPFTFMIQGTGTNKASSIQIVRQPVSREVFLGRSVAFRVLARGARAAGPLRYQWYFNGKLVPGATKSSLLRTKVQNSAVGEYAVVVSNADSAMTSAAAVLTPKKKIGRNIEFMVRIVPEIHADGHLRARIIGAIGRRVMLQTSTDMIHWTTTDTRTNTVGGVTFDIPSGGTKGFYRILNQ